MTPLDVTVASTAVDGVIPRFSEDEAVLAWDFGGSAQLDRRAGRVVLSGVPDAEYLPHPMLVASTALMAHWEGRVALHAASVAIDGRGLLVVGGKFAGKSTLVGALALAGHGVIADDVSISRADGRLATGPRLVDLRPEGAALLGVGDDRTVVVRAGANRRLPVDPVPEDIRAATIVSLRWGERWSVEALGARERFALVLGALVLDPRMTTPGALTHLLALPAWRVVRPRSGAGDLAEGARRIALLAAR